MVYHHRMSIERARSHLAHFALQDRIYEFDTSSATVDLAAAALGCEPQRIAKTLAFEAEAPILVVAAGDARVDNRKFRDQFGIKPRMISGDKIAGLVGYPAGGVCPFGVNEGVRIYLDESLSRFDVVFPAAGNAASAVRLTLAELELASSADGWVDVSRLPDRSHGQPG